MKECILFVPYVYEGSIKAGHYLFYFAEVNIPNVKLIVVAFLMQLYQLLVF